MAYASTGLPILSVGGSAAANNAAVTMALWNDYQQNFAPYQYQQLESLTSENPGIVGNEVAVAKNQVGMSFDSAKNNRMVTMSRLGMAPDAQMRQSVDRSSALSKASAMAAAANTTRQNLKKRDMLIMTGGVPNVAGRAYGMSGD